MATGIAKVFTLSIVEHRPVIPERCSAIGAVIFARELAV